MVAERKSYIIQVCRAGRVAQDKAKYQYPVLLQLLLIGPPYRTDSGSAICLETLGRWVPKPDKVCTLPADAVDSIFIHHSDDIFYVLLCLEPSIPRSHLAAEVPAPTASELRHQIPHRSSIDGETWSNQAVYLDAPLHE